MTRRKDELARDLELLVERLAESREAIARLLASAGADEPAERLELVPTPIKLVPEPVELATEPLQLAPEPVEPSRPMDGPAATRKRATWRPGASVPAVIGSQGATGAGTVQEPAAGAVVALRDQSKGDLRLDGETSVPVDANSGEARAARRRLAAVVLVAVGAVILLTTLVSLL